ncbi:TolC family protein [PVC group bacterium]|nr:TolC family protein [PVC group bacterium]
MIQMAQRMSILLLILIVLSVGNVANSEERIGKLSIDETVEIGILNNIRVKVARLEQDLAGLDLKIERSIFDTEAWFEINWRRDKRASINSIGGSRVTDQNYNIGIDKKIPTGADISLSFRNQDLDTSSPFFPIDPAFVSDMEASITQPLLKNIGGIQDKAPIRISEIEIDRIDIVTQDTIEEVIAEIKLSYWDLVFAQETLKAQKEILEKAQQLLEFNIENRKSGLAEDVDIYASEANTERHMNNVLVAQNELVTAIETLKLKMNYPYFSRIVPTEELSYKSVFLDQDTIMRNAIKNRRDYITKRLQIEQADIDVHMKKNSRWPQMDLIATFNANGLKSNYPDAVAEMAVASNPSYFLGVEFRFPLANTKAKAQYQSSLLEKARLILEFRQLEKDIAFEVDDVVRAVLTNSAQAGKRIRIEELESKKLEEEDRNYRLGRSNSNIIIDYQDDLIEARLAKIEALIDLEKSLVNLDRSRNILFDQYFQSHIISQLGNTE